MFKAGFIGGGNMAEAIIKGILSNKTMRPKNVIVSDISASRLETLKENYKIAVTHDNLEAAKNSRILFLCVKPQSMEDLLTELTDGIAGETVVVSIVAGITTEFIQDILGDVPVIRVMPNTPALCGAGAAGIYATAIARDSMDEVVAIFDAVGKTVVVEDEAMMDTVTAVSGSGPAYFFLLMEEMIAAAQELGMDYDSAKLLTLQTAYGAARLAIEADKTGETPKQLRERVTSPGGTTAAALKIFERDQFGAIVLMAIESARQRSKELSEGTI